MLRVARISGILSVILLVAGGLPQAVHAVQAGVTNNTVRFNTPLGTIDVDLYNNDAPITVANFLKYVTDGDYNNSFFHRLVQGFVLQGGGFTYNNSDGNLYFVPTDAPIQNEYHYSNVRGTIAMAKLGGDPNSATSQFFFNLGDNSANLDAQNGGFTVFGTATASGMTVVDKLAGVTPNAANVHVWNASSIYSAFDTLPLINYPTNTAIGPYLELVSGITILPTGPQPWKLTGGGVWNSNANWAYGNTANGNGAAAVFGNNLIGAATIDLGTTPQTINTIRFTSGSNNGAYTVAGSGAGILTLDGGNGSATIQLDNTNQTAQTINAPIVYATDCTITNNSSAGALLVLGGAQNWNNKTVTVAAGGVRFNNATTTGSVSNATLSIISGAGAELAGANSGVIGVAVTNNGTLAVTGTNQAIRGLSGSGTTTVASGGALTVGTQTNGTRNAETGGITQSSLSIGGNLRNDGNTTFAAAFNPASAAAVSLSSSSAAALSVGTTGNVKVGNISFTNATGGGTVADGGQLTAGTIDGSTQSTFVNGKNATSTVSHIVLGGGLTLQGDDSHLTGKFTISASGSGAAGASAGTSRIGSLSIASNNILLPTPPGSRTYYSTLDLGNNDLVIASGTLADVADMIRSGQGGTGSSLPWTGKGLTSSYAANTSSPYFGGVGLGAIRNDSIPNTATVESAAYSSFGGVTGLTGNEILVKFTYYGDLDLDGKVTAIDYALFDAGYAGTIQSDGRPGWFYGDIKNDGQVNAADAGLFNAGRLAYANAGSFTPLPEPGTFVLAAMGSLALIVAYRRCRA